jgi:hypothetical protein
VDALSQIVMPGVDAVRDPEAQGGGVKKSKKKPSLKHRLNGKRPEAKTMALVAQAHGGAIKTGGNPGNKGGTGRPPSAIRARMREHLDSEVLDKVMEEFDDGKLDTLDVADFLAKYGLGTMKEVTVENVRERLRLTLEVLRRELSAPQLRIIIPQIEGVWKG